MLSDSRIRQLVRLLYIAAILILLNQFMEAFFQLAQGAGGSDSASLRFRLLTILASRAGWLVVADALLFAAVIRLDNRTGLQALGWGNLILAIGLGLALMVMVRDARALRGANGSGGFGVLRAGVPLALIAVLTLLAGLISVRKSKKPDWAGKVRPATPLLTDTLKGQSPSRRTRG
jgi:hypothetical protein